MSEYGCNYSHVPPSSLLLLLLSSLLLLVVLVSSESSYLLSYSLPPFLKVSFVPHSFPDPGFRIHFGFTLKAGTEFKEILDTRNKVRAKSF